MVLTPIDENRKEDLRSGLSPSSQPDDKPPKTLDKIRRKVAVKYGFNSFKELMPRQKLNKEHSHLYIDKVVLERAKKLIPNLSFFVESMRGVGFEPTNPFGSGS